MEGPPIHLSDLKYRLLLEISQRISRSFDLQENLTHVLDSIRSAIAYDAAGIFVLNRSVPLARQTGPFVIAGMATIGFTKIPSHDDQMLRFGHGIVGHVIMTGETVIAPDVRLDPRYVAGREATLSEIAVPLMSNEQVIGALNLESDRVDAFSAADAHLLEFFANAAAIAIQKELLHQQVLEKQRIEDQLRVARDVQGSLLPAAPPSLPGYDIAAANLPAWEIGGDYYDYVPLPDGRLGLIIADVAGKGIAAALIMASFRAALRTVLRRAGPIQGAVEDVNRVLSESSGVLRFVTAVFGIFDPQSGSLTYVNCGHSPPLLLRSAGGREVLDLRGPALGILDDWRFEPTIVSLDPGDLLALYTDGVVEVQDPRGVEFGLERLEGVLRARTSPSAREQIWSVVDATRAFSERSSFEDDFTLVLVKRVA